MYSACPPRNLNLNPVTYQNCVNLVQDVIHNSPNCVGLEHWSAKSYSDFEVAVSAHGGGAEVLGPEMTASGAAVIAAPQAFRGKCPTWMESLVVQTGWGGSLPPLWASNGC